MPKIGLTQQYVAKREYDPASQTASYTGCRRLARIVNYSTSVNSTDDNNDYGDNVAIENAGGEFADGTMSVETAELMPEDGFFVIGMETEEITVDGSPVTIYREGGVVNPELGWGVVEKWQVNNAIKWRAVILPRIKFNVPSDEVATQGESIEWQHDTLEAAILREQQGKHDWRIKSDLVETEEAAAAIVRQLLDFTGELPEG